ncbi:deoxyribodipyrimidine photo-lyase, partial [Candidatus Dependentiae bacterium]|nr:deoxyribodipyrimidine photo-lyase [Candidatus Dependentiae bacterium]
MKHQYETSLFIFRRDLRLEDNRGLIKALKSSNTVIPCFIVTPEQTGSKNSYRGKPSLQFMVQSLVDLDSSLSQYGARLHIFHGEPKAVLESLLSNHPISAVFINRDYTPYSTERDTVLAQLCTAHQVPFIIEHDALLHEPEESSTSQGKPYQIFTPFFRKNSLFVVKEAVSNHYINYLQGETLQLFREESLSLEALHSLLIPVPVALRVHGGRTSSLQLLGALKNFRDYAATRDFPEHDTTLLSASLKFGTLSIREVYHAITVTLGAGHPLIRQLFWRDFFYSVAFFYPSVFGHAFHRQYDTIAWNTDYAAFSRWCEGTTGFPIVDAGMRQLMASGFMHNRARLITGSFLVKDLHCDWRLGERYFAQHLTDYDPCINNGNWQWVASTGCDNQPYFRIFNPW